MKICVIQEAGVHPQNAHLRECFCLKRAFELIPEVEDVTVWGRGHSGFIDTPDWNEFNIIINIENYSHSWMPDLSKTTRPMKFVWSIDSHVSDVTPYKKIFEDGKYHYFLQATSIFVDRVPNSIWFPNAYDHTQLIPSLTPISDRKKLIGFCGSQLNRGDICKKLQKKYPDFAPDYWKLGQDMIDCIQSYKIHFNLNMNWDINYRNFETCGLGTVLLTNNNMNSKDYEELGFRHGQNCLFWNSKDEQSLFRVINEWKDDVVSLEKIAINGADLVKDCHTYYNRVKDVIRLYNGEKLDAASFDNNDNTA